MRRPASLWFWVLFDDLDGVHVPSLVDFLTSMSVGLFYFAS